MKKLLAVLLASVVVLGLLAGCNKKDTQQNEEPKNVTVDETVIYNDNDITITVTEMKKTYLGVQFSVDVRNRSENNIILTSTHFVVNGITVNGGCYIECDADRSAQDTLYLYKNSLENAGIKTVATIRGIDCSIVDSDSFNPLYTFSFDLVTSAGANYQQEINTDGDVLLETNGIKILSQDFTDDVYGDVARLVMVNNSDKSVIVEAEEIKVNGILVDGFLYDTVYAGTVRFTDLSLYSSALKESGITAIENISFKLTIVDAKTFAAIEKSKEIVISID